MRELRLFTRLADYVSEPEQAEDLVELFTPYLRLKSTPRTERVKESVLRLLANLLRLSRSPHLHFRTFALLFGSLRARPSRLAMCDLFAAYAGLPAIHGCADLGGVPAATHQPAPVKKKGKKAAATTASGSPKSEKSAKSDTPLHGVASCLSSLNAYSATDLEEPDYDLRIAGCVGEVG
jgi:hypothetical protein